MLGKRGPKPRYNDEFHKEARRRMRKYREKWKRQEAAKKRRRKK